MNIIITGYAGFIGFHLVKKFLENEKIDKIYCIDNFNKYYDVNLKINRHKKIIQIDLNQRCKFIKLDIKNKNKLIKYFTKIKIDFIFHLAAQAGINYSLTNPDAYISSNLIGFFNILELVKIKKVKNLVYSSTSSVYGMNAEKKLHENLPIQKPLQLYSATKVSNEAMAHAYANIYKFNSVGLRFFTVFGPWGRPDMAVYKFTDCILNNKKIDLFKYKSNFVKRDFTYIDDIIVSMDKIFNYLNKNNLVDVFNIGNSKPVSIKYLLQCIENELGVKAKTSIKKLSVSEMNSTNCDISKFKKKFNYKPNTKIEDGIKHFISWYKNYKRFD